MRKRHSSSYVPLFPPGFHIFTSGQSFTPKSPLNTYLLPPLGVYLYSYLFLLTLFPSFRASNSLIIIVRLIPPNTNSHPFTPSFSPCSTAIPRSVIVKFALFDYGLIHNSSLKCPQLLHPYHLFHLIVSLFPYLHYTVSHNFTRASQYNTLYFHNSTYDYYKSQNEECQHSDIQILTLSVITRTVLIP